jgi:hypothetical protein
MFAIIAAKNVGLKLVNYCTIIYLNSYVFQTVSELSLNNEITHDGIKLIF